MTLTLCLAPSKQFHIDRPMAEAMGRFFYMTIDKAGFETYNITNVILLEED